MLIKFINTIAGQLQLYPIDHLEELSKLFNYIYLNYSYDEFTNFVIKTGNIGSVCYYKMNSELGSMRFKKLYIKDLTKKNEFIKTHTKE